MKKILFFLFLLLMLGAIGYVLFNFTSLKLPTGMFNKEVKDTRVIRDQKLQSGMQYVNSGMQRLESGAQNLLQSWQSLFNDKKKEAEDYLRGQKEQLKNDAQQAVQDAAKEKILSSI